MGCYGYQPAWGVGDDVVAAASSSSAIKVSLTNRPTYQKAPKSPITWQANKTHEDRQANKAVAHMRNKTLNGARHAALGQEDQNINR